MTLLTEPLTQTHIGEIMAEKPSKNANPAAASLEKAENQENEVATQETGAPPLRLGQSNVEETPEQILASGGMPVLKCAYGVGALSKEHVPGTWVLGDYILAKKKETLKVYVAGFRRYYKEVTDYQPGVPVRAQTLPTSEAVKALGKTTEWTDGPDGRRIAPDFRPAADFILLIEKPEGHTSPYFTLRFGDKSYALVRYYTDKASYDKAGDPMVRVVIQTKPMWAAEFDLHTDDVKLGRQEATLPVTKIIGPTPEDLVKEITASLPQE